MPRKGKQRKLNGMVKIYRQQGKLPSILPQSITSTLFYLNIDSSPLLPSIVLSCKEVNVRSQLIMAASNKGRLHVINIEMTLFLFNRGLHTQRVDGSEDRCTQIKEETNRFNNRIIR